MKSILLKHTAFCSLTLFMAVVARSETGVVSTAFWQAPYETNVKIKLAAQDSRLTAICGEFRDLVGGSPDQDIIDAEEMQTLRNLNDSMNESSFSTIFTIDGVSTQGALDTQLKVANQKFTPNQGGKSDLYQYTQVSTHEIPQMSLHTNIALTATPNSLLQRSRKLGLKDQEPTLSGDNMPTKLKVFGKDAACDILRGDVTVEFDSRAKVQISLQAQTSIDNFYLSIEKMTASIFADRKTPTAKAIAFGYRAQDVFHPLGITESEGEQITEALVNVLFDSEMNRTAIWSNFNGESHLNVQGAAFGPVHVQLGSQL